MGQFNCTVKVYPDGRVQYIRLPQVRAYDYKQADLLPTEIVHDGSSVERKEHDNMKRAIQAAYDLALSTTWDIFVTLTFDPKKVNSFCYADCIDAVRHWTNNIKHRYGCSWLIVPEQHMSGRYHFHGLIAGSLAMVKADARAGEGVYNIPTWKYGFSSASYVGDSGKASSYVLKYMTKEMSAPKGSRRYINSRDLVKPEKERVVLTEAMFDQIRQKADFLRLMDSPYGLCELCEIHKTDGVPGSP